MTNCHIISWLDQGDIFQAFDGNNIDVQEVRVLLEDGCAYKVDVMENADKVTIETYDRSARELADYFAGIGSRLDVIFGFASYLHLDKSDFRAACRKAMEALRAGGLLVMTLKERDQYETELVEDEFGKRMFYYYNESTVRACADEGFEVIRLEHHVLRRKTAKWLLIILKKIDKA